MTIMRLIIAALILAAFSALAELTPEQEATIRDLARTVPTRHPGKLYRALCLPRPVHGAVTQKVTRASYSNEVRALSVLVPRYVSVAELKAAKSQSERQALIEQRLITALDEASDYRSTVAVLSDQAKVKAWNDLAKEEGGGLSDPFSGQETRDEVWTDGIVGWAPSLLEQAGIEETLSADDIVRILRR